MSLSFCHDVIVPDRREEYHVWATLRTGMTKDFAMTAVLPSYKDIGVVWFKKCNANGNGNGLRSITGGNKFE
jgi:hypothetical protein